MTDRESRRGERRERMRERSERYYSSRGHIWVGLIIVLIGLAAFIKSMMFPLPDWMFSWQMLLIAIGILLGFKHEFRGGSWFVLILVGLLFLLEEYFLIGSVRRFIWPVAIIALGLLLIMRPRRNRRWMRNEWNEDDAIKENSEATTATGDAAISDDDLIDSSAIMGGIKKNILSKNFKGGRVFNLFGGTDLNFTQADIQGRVELEITQFFAGTKIIVPSNWEVKPAMSVILGGIEDKRDIQRAVINPDKVLVLKGSTVFGGIEIKSY